MPCRCPVLFVSLPCVYYGDPVRECTCSNSMVSRYQKRISDPLLDRIDTPEAYRGPSLFLSTENRAI